MIGILYNIRSAYNVGSIFRTADGAGFTKLYLCGITPTPHDTLGRTRKDMVKVSLGAEQTILWEKIARAADCIKKLQREGYFVCAVEIAPGAIPYYIKDVLKNHARIAILMGHEVTGLPKALRDRCDSTIGIPLYGKKESLNVAVAFGIIAFEIAKYRVS